MPVAFDAPSSGPDDGHGATTSDPASRAFDRSHAKLADSVVVLEESAVEQNQSADRRTEFAAVRTILAAERTYAAWIRTGLTALASGVGARALLNGVVPVWLVGAMGTVLIVFAGFCFVAAVWREVSIDVPTGRSDMRRLSKPLLIALSVFLVLVSAAVAVGIWTPTA